MRGPGGADWLEPSSVATVTPSSRGRSKQVVGLGRWITDDG